MILEVSLQRQLVSYEITLNIIFAAMLEKRHMCQQEFRPYHNTSIWLKVFRVHSGEIGAGRYEI